MSNPFAVLITGLAQALSTPFGAAATAAAIVTATILVRLFLLPLGYAAHRADLRRNALLGKAAELGEAERAALLQAEGGSLLLGCLPMLFQIPVFAGLYQAVLSSQIGQQTLFGVPLGAHLFGAAGPQLLVFLALLVLMVAIAYASTRLLGVTGKVAKLVPYATPVFATFLPLAAALYLVTTTAWTIAQTVALRHWIT